MELNVKLQELRKQRGLTQEELAEKLYVSRTAISKWESGRGYPSIESLKAIAGFFSVTVDELLSSEEILTIAEENQRQSERRLLDLIFGLLDLIPTLLLFLPMFASKSEGVVQAASLLKLEGVQTYIKIGYFLAVAAVTVMGIATLAFQNISVRIWQKGKCYLSLSLGAALAFVFMISLQPYAAAFAFFLLSIKVIILLKRQ